MARLIVVALLSVVCAYGVAVAQAPGESQAGDKPKQAEAEKSAPEPLGPAMPPDVAQPQTAPEIHPIKPRVYRSSCGETNDHDEADLCEQRRMAEMAEKTLRTTYIQIGLSAFGLGAILWSLWYSRISAKAAIDSADASIRSADAAHHALTTLEQPFLFDGNLKLVLVKDDQPLRIGFSPQLYDLVAAGSTWGWIHYELRNHGRTPAVLLAFAGQADIVTDLPEVPLFRDSDVKDEDVRQVLSAGEKQGLRAFIREPITPEVVNDIRVRDRTLFFFGWARYRDYLGWVHTIGYCWKYNPNSNKFYPDHREAYNYRTVTKPGDPLPPLPAVYSPKPGESPRRP